jgi:hypothetical protein
MKPQTKLFLTLMLLALAGLQILAAGCQTQTQAPPEAQPAGEAAASGAEAAPPPAAEPPAAAPPTAPAAKPAAKPAETKPAAPTEPAKPAEPVFVMAVVPEGKNISITLDQPISSKTSMPGQSFTATVRFDVQTRAHPAPIIPAGSLLSGTIVEAQKASQFKGQAKLVVKFNELRLPSGKSIPVTASLVTEGEDTTKRTAGGIAGGAAAGAILGKIIGKDTKGAAIGAVAGAAIGTGVVVGLDNKDVELPAGTDLVVNVDTELQVPVPQGA